MFANKYPCQERVQPSPQCDEMSKDPQLIYAQICYDGHQLKWPYVWVSSLWIPHGAVGWQGRIYSWKQMGRKRRRESSSWESPAGHLLMVEWITDVWQCLMSECNTLSLTGHFYSSKTKLGKSAKAMSHSPEIQRGSSLRHSKHLKLEEDYS